MFLSQADNFSYTLASVVIWMSLACIPAGIAQYKGHRAGVFFIYGLILFPLALVHATLATSRRDEAMLAEVRAQTVFLKRILDGASPPANAPTPIKPVSAGVSVEPTARRLRLTPAEFIDQARAIGLEAGERDGRPYRVLSDGDIEALRTDGDIDVFANWPAFALHRPTRTKGV